MATKVPAYTYTGAHESRIVNGTWYVYLKSSGTLTFSYAKPAQLCLVGGGGGGLPDIGGNGGNGGGGGQVISGLVSLESGRGYGVSIGAGGGIGQNGGATTGFGITASGGAAGGGGQAPNDANNWSDPQAGADGTYPFGDSSLRRYGACGGGGGAGCGGAGGQDGGGRGATNYGDGATNGEDGMGAGGGGGAYNLAGGSGGSGIVILRGTEDDFLPVKFGGVQLSKILFNGEEVTGLVYGGTTIFARRCRAWLLKRLARRFAFRRATPAM